MTATGVLLIALFAALIGGVVGYNVARNKYYQPRNRAGGGSGSPAGNKTERRD